MISRSVRLMALLSIAVLLLASVVSASIKKEINKEFEVGSGGELTLETEIGSVEILTTDENKVYVDVVLDSRTSKESRAEDMFEDFEIDFEIDGDNVNITAEYYGNRNNIFNLFGSRKSLRVKYEIRVPAKYDIFIETSGGSIGVGDVEGKVRVKTSGGSLHFEDIKGPVKGRTSGGSIVLESCKGYADIKTSGGSIDIGHVEGEVEAHTSGGSISVDEVMGAIDASTSGGSIVARITKQPQNDCRLTTSGGSVNVYLTPDINVEIDARTSAGRVRSDFEETSSKKRSSKRKSRLVTTIGNGGPEIYLRTSGGDIRIHER
ncbi:MAG: DUF4097 family beta strand repeat protein [candidate division Zixibacteria bacterium]|nr:DUF4097 family beta strand repeat protein [candidate division Zixibacteria bacterium]